MGTSDQVLKDLLKRPKARNVDEVIARMRTIDQTLPTKDGVAWFNKMYLKTTENVLGAVGEGFFKHPEFMRQLDLAFANLYFTALAESLNRPERIPKAWKPLFTDRDKKGVAPIQFAIVGMNAHINYDLATAVVQTCKSMGVSPDARHKRDYDLINSILQSTQDQVKIWFATGFVGVVDEVFGRLDDVMANWSIVKARQAGWVNSTLLWGIQSLPPVRAAFLDNLGQMVAFAGRGLLIPTL